MAHDSHLDADDMDAAPSAWVGMASIFDTPGPDTPGFHLIDDADGRFVVDRDMGVITLADESLLEREYGAVHAACLGVIEPSGVTYEVELKLVINGRVPQVLGDDPLLTDGRPAPKRAKAPEIQPWTTFAAAQGASARTPIASHETAPFGALLMPAPARANLNAAKLVGIGAPPAPFSARAAWPG